MDLVGVELTSGCIFDSVTVWKESGNVYIRTVVRAGSLAGNNAKHNKQYQRQNHSGIT